MSMSSRHSSRSRDGHIAALDFDANRKAPSLDTDISRDGRSSPPGLLRDDESLLSNVVDGIIQKDRRKIKAQVSRYLSYASAILSWSAFYHLISL